MPVINVNVIFHGLFLFVLKKGYIDVLMPMMDDHSYRAGPFLAGETLQPRPLSQPYALAGVEAGTGTFNPATNWIIGKFDYDHYAGPDKVYARLLLPYPEAIVSLRPTSQALVAPIDPGGLLTCTQPCGLQIFQYAAVDSAGNPAPRRAKL